VAALLWLLNGCGSADKIVLQEVSEKVYTVEPTANISIHNRDGAILVYGSDVNELRVQSLKRAYNQERLNQIAIDVSTQPGALSVTAKFPPGQNGPSGIPQAQSISPLLSLRQPALPRWI